MDVTETYCGDHFALYTYMESLHCTLETNMLHVHYTTVKKGFDAKDEMKKRRERYKNTQTYAFNRSKM